MNLELFNKIKNFLFPLKQPTIDDNTFIVWEPCSTSHSEVVPGYAKYLLDLGYTVSICVEPNHIKNGLFSRFDNTNKNLIINNLNSKQVRKYFKKADLSNLKGILVTTVGKLCDCIHYEQAYEIFNNSINQSKLHFVEHKAKNAIDNNSWREKNITLRKLNYKNANSVVVNPFYFGEKINFTSKNEITNFITIGAIRSGKKNTSAIIKAVQEIHDRGITNFKLTVVGKGNLKNIPKSIRKYIDFKGRLPFNKMYEEIEKADFILTSYDKNAKEHYRYIQYQTSGNFQLVYGFLKPVILIKDFGSINGFDENNSILYDSNEDYVNAMIKAINLSKEDYKIMQNNLKIYSENLYKTSLNNLKRLINE